MLTGIKQDDGTPPLPSPTTGGETVVETTTAYVKRRGYSTMV